jgi:regulator of protease activity HflC (stomatin/prohibitin superfamily)
MVWTTIILSILILGFIILGLVFPKNWTLIEPNEKGFVMLFGRVTHLRGPGPVHTWPWEEIVVRPISQIKGTLVIKLTTGGSDADEFVLKIPFVYHIVDVVKSVFAYRGDINKGLEDFVQASFQEALLKVGGHAILDGKLQDVVMAALVDVKTIADSWGLLIDSLKISDVNLSDSLKKRINLIREAEGRAGAVRIESAAEIEAYKKERVAQGSDYRFHQALDAVQQMAASGAFRFVGDFKGVISSLAVIEDGEVTK